MEQTQPTKEHKVFLAGVSPIIKHSDLQAFFSREYTSLSKIEVKDNKEGAEKITGFAVIVLNNQSDYNSLIRTKYVKIKGRVLVATPFFTGKELEEHRHRIKRRRLYVTKIPQKMTNEQLEDVLKKYGPLEQAYIVKETRIKSKRKKFGYATFFDAEDARMALRDGEIPTGDGDTIIVKPMRDRNEMAAQTRGLEGPLHYLAKSDENRGSGRRKGPGSDRSGLRVEGLSYERGDPRGGEMGVPPESRRGRADHYHSGGDFSEEWAPEHYLERRRPNSDFRAEMGRRRLASYAEGKQRHLDSPGVDYNSSAKRQKHIGYYDENWEDYYYYYENGERSAREAYPGGYEQAFDQNNHDRCLDPHSYIRSPENYSYNDTPYLERQQPDYYEELSSNPLNMRGNQPERSAPPDYYYNTNIEGREAPESAERWFQEEKEGLHLENRIESFRRREAIKREIMTLNEMERRIGDQIERPRGTYQPRAPLLTRERPNARRALIDDYRRQNGHEYSYQEQDARVRGDQDQYSHSYPTQGWSEPRLPTNQAGYLVKQQTQRKTTKQPKESSLSSPYLNPSQNKRRSPKPRFSYLQENSKFADSRLEQAILSTRNHCIETNHRYRNLKLRAHETHESENSNNNNSYFNSYETERN